MLTDQQHPITPPPELVQQWRKSGPADAAVNNAYEQHIATQAARCGADQELQACLQLLDINGCPSKWIDMLRAARRRPQAPPSLVEQALDLLDRLRSETWCEEIDFDLDPIRAALERLQELESNG